MSTEPAVQAKGIQDTFMLAVLKGNIHEVHEIVDNPENVKKIDVNALDKKTGMAALHHATAKRDIQMVKHLLQMPATKIDLLDSEKRSPLRIAVENKDKGIVSYLIGRGADYSNILGEPLPQGFVEASADTKAEYLIENAPAPRKQQPAKKGHARR